MLTTAAVLTLAAALAHAAPPVDTITQGGEASALLASVLSSFEASLGQIRRQALATRGEHKKAKALSLKAEIDSAAREASRLSWDASRQRGAVSELRRRAQRYEPDRPQRPGSDPFFRSDLQRAVWNLRDLSRETRRLSAAVQRLAQTAPKDPALLQPAEALLRNAGHLRGEARWLETEADRASWDIRRAGFSLEAWDIERESRNTSDSSRQIEAHAGRLVDAVRSPEAPAPVL